jgi:Short C-terminal domain
MRQRLERLGIDPDQPGRRGWDRPKQRELSANETADELARLRDLHDKGALNDDEYEQARQRLRRY